MRLSPTLVKDIARRSGFDLAGIAPAQPLPDFAFYRQWTDLGMGGRMGYLADYRAAKRADPRTLLPTAQSLICVGKLYHTKDLLSIDARDPQAGWISRYAWGDDYHHLMRRPLDQMVRSLQEATANPFDFKICLDTAPLLERSYARQAGLGWIGKNTCLIHEPLGSWFFLAEVLTSLKLQPDSPPPDRCGSCTRCIDACPTQALVPVNGPAGVEWALDARLCISYLTIELRGPIPTELRAGTGSHLFGCDICQDVCPWNSRAPVTGEPGFQPQHAAPPLAELAALTEEEFRQRFASSPVSRARYSGFLRNVAVAMGNAAEPRFREPLENLSRHPDETVAEHARWALTQLEAPVPCSD